MLAWSYPRQLLFLNSIFSCFIISFSYFCVPGIELRPLHMLNSCFRLSLSQTSLSLSLSHTHSSSPAVQIFLLYPELVIVDSSKLTQDTPRPSLKDIYLSPERQRAGIRGKDRRQRTGRRGREQGEWGGNKGEGERKKERGKGYLSETKDCLG